MMTRAERRQLRQIERSVYATDPHWARLIAGGLPSHYERKRRRVNILLDVLAVLVLAVGALTGTPLLLFTGAVLAVISTGLHLSRRRYTSRPRLAG